MNIRTILLTSVAAGALAVTVGACTHSGDDGIPQSQLDAETAAKEAAEKKAAEEQAAKEQAEADAKAEKERADALQREKDAEATEAGKDKLKRLATAIGANEREATTDMTVEQLRVRHFRDSGTGNDGYAKPEKDTKDLDDPYAISDWKGSAYRYSPQGSVRDVASYNNKEEPTSVLFTQWLGVATVNDDGSYDLDPGEHAKHVSISGLPTHSSHDPLEIGVTNGERGTLNGVPGRFKGEGGPVNIMVNNADVPTWTSGTLTFKPDSPTAMVSQEDQSYMSLGWWLTEQDSDGALTVEVAAWGSQAYITGAGRGNELTGKATFEGIAVGKYTHKVVNDISGGHFNADAMLEADFESTSAAGSLTGTIDNFMQDGESIGQDWKVALNDLTDANTSNIGDNFVVAAAANSATGTFGRHETDGSWQARFVGNGRTDPMPEGVVGEFHIGAPGDPINMVGAFAASNMEADQVDRP